METLYIDQLPTIVPNCGSPSVTLVAPVRLPHERSHAELDWKRLIGEARERLLLETDPATVDRILAPAVALLDGSWPTHESSIALVGGPDGHTLASIARPVEPFVSVGRLPALHVLAGLVGAEPFVVLALGLHDTRLLDGDATGVHARAETTVPRRVEDVIHRDERGQHLSRHGGGVQGSRGIVGIQHGEDDASTEHRRELDVFCRHVDDAVWHELSLDDKRPLVVAGVTDLVARFRTVSKHPERISATVEGSADRMRDPELHTAAVGALNARQIAQLDELVARFRSLHGSGLAGDDPTDLTAAAGEGRIETLLVPAPEVPADDSALDDLVGTALAQRARVVLVPAGRIERPAAIFRW